MSKESQVEVLGVRFDNLTMREAVDAALALIAEHRCTYAATPNPEIVMLSRKDASLSSALKEASLVIADGVGIVYGAQILGTPLKARLPGIDFAGCLMQELAKTNGRVFLFGAKPGIAELAAQTLTATHPGLSVCGTHNGYFSDDAEIIAEINAAKPDLLLVCLGAPKQELWMQANAGKLNAGLMIGLGGSLDVFAGTVRRAPESWCKLGLEWLYRLIKEPRRIGRMRKLPVFLIAVIRCRLLERRRLRGNSDAR